MTEMISTAGVVLDLERRHEAYEGYVRQYEFLWNSYQGGDAYAPELYLDQYTRETNQQFDLRKTRAYYLNYVAAVVDAYIAQIFRRDPVRELPDAMRSFEEDATGEGDSLTDFTRETMTWAVAALRSFVVVDVDGNGQPYAHLIHPQNLLDFAREPRTGEYGWALIAEEHVDEADPFADRLIEQRYRLWLPERWMLFDDEGVQIDEQPNRAGVVPLVEAVPGNMPLPMVDIASIGRRIYNICSQIDEILVNVTFPQPYLQEAQAGVEDAATGSQISGDVSPIVMGTTRMFLLPHDANIPPGYLVPPDGPLIQQMAERERLISGMYSLGGLERQDPDAQRVQSGVAKSYDFKETNARLGSFAQASERLELLMLELVAAYGIGSDSGVNVAYRKDYNVRDFRLVLEDWMLIEKTILPPAAKRRSMEELTGQIAEDASPEEKQEIQDAVENMPDEAFEAAGNLAAPPPPGFGGVAPVTAQQPRPRLIDILGQSEGGE